MQKQIQCRQQRVSRETEAAPVDDFEQQMRHAAAERIAQLDPETELILDEIDAVLASNELVA